MSTHRSYIFSPATASTVSVDSIAASVLGEDTALSIVNFGVDSEIEQTALSGGASVRSIVDHLQADTPSVIICDIAVYRRRMAEIHTLADGHPERGILLVGDDDDEVPLSTLSRSDIHYCPSDTDVSGFHARLLDLREPVAQKWTTTGVSDLLDAIPTAVIFADAETGVVVDANSVAASLLECPREELVGSRQTDIYPPECRSAATDGFESVVNGYSDRWVGGDGSDPLYVRTGRGDEVPVEIRARRVDLGYGKLVASAFTDVTSKVESRKKIRRLTAGIEASMTGIAILDDEEGYVYMNDSHAEMFGFEVDELIGKSWRVLYDSDEVQRIESAVLSAFEENGQWRGELTGRTQYGGRIEQDVQLTAIDDGLVCVCQDVTARRQRDRTLAYLREATEQLIEAEELGEAAGRLATMVENSLPVAAAGVWDRHTAVGRVERLDSGSELDLDLTGESIPAEEADAPFYLGTEERTLLAYPIGERWLLVLEPEGDSVFGPTVEGMLELIGRYAETAFAAVYSRSELEATKEAIERERRRLREIIDLVPHFIFAKNARGEFLLANRAVADAYGTTTDAIEGQTDATFSATDEEADHFVSKDLEVIESGEPTKITNERITDVNGNRRVLDTWKIPFDSADEPAVLGVSVDVTELRQTKASLRRLKERDAAFELIQSMISIDSWENARGVATGQLSEMLDGGYAAIYEWSDEDGVLVPSAVEGTVELPTIGPERSTIWDAFVDRVDDPTTLEGVPDGFPPSYHTVLVDTVDDGCLVVVGATVEPTDERLELLETVTSYLQTVLGHLREHHELVERKTALERRSRELERSKRLNERLKRSIAALVESGDRQSLKRTVADRLSGPENRLTVVVRDPSDENVAVGDGTVVTQPTTNPLLSHDGWKTPADEVETTGESIYIPSIVACDRFPEWRRHALERRYQSHLSVPMTVDGVNCGFLELYTPVQDGFTSTERNAIEQFTELFASVLSDVELRSHKAGVDQLVTVAVSGDPLSTLRTELTLRSQSVIMQSPSEAIVYAEIDGVSPEEFERSLGEVESVVQVSVSSSDQGPEAEFHLEEFGPFRLFARLGTAIESMVVRNGRTEYTVTVPSSVDISRVVESAASRYDAAELVRKRSAASAQESVSRTRTMLTESLTDRQRDVLEVAVAAGYYDQPRAATGDDLAEQLGVSRQTVNYHLRRAEGTILQTLVTDGDR